MRFPLPAARMIALSPRDDAVEDAAPELACEFAFTDDHSTNWPARIRTWTIWTKTRCATVTLRAKSTSQTLARGAGSHSVRFIAQATRSPGAQNHSYLPRPDQISRLALGDCDRCMTDRPEPSAAKLPEAGADISRAP